MTVSEVVRALARGAVQDLRGPRELLRLRLAHPGATVQAGVRFSGDLARTRLGDGVTLCGPSVVSVCDGGGLSGALLSVGDGTYVGEFANLRCAGAPIVIGRRCMVAQHVSVLGSNHGTALGTPLDAQPWHGRGVHVGDDVWIGAGAVILPGSTIADGAVVAAGSVVRGEIGTRTIVAGVPARAIRQRS